FWGLLSIEVHGEFDRAASLVLRAERLSDHAGRPAERAEKIDGHARFRGVVKLLHDARHDPGEAGQLPTPENKHPRPNRPSGFARQPELESFMVLGANGAGSQGNMSEVSAWRVFVVERHWMRPGLQPSVFRFEASDAITVDPSRFVFGADFFLLVPRPG